MKDFTAKEAIAAFVSLTKQYGERCDVYLSLNFPRGYIDVSGGIYNTTVYPDGLSKSRERVSVDGDSWRECLTKCETELDGRKDQRAATLIRTMALEIISLTADHGKCTDAALRAKFDAREVAEYGERACEQASAMANNGPFSIVALAGANAA